MMAVENNTVQDIKTKQLMDDGRLVVQTSVGKDKKLVIGGRREPKVCLIMSYCGLSASWAVVVTTGSTNKEYRV